MLKGLDYERNELCKPFLKVKQTGYDSCNNEEEINLCQVQPTFCAGHLDMPRCALPQFPAEDMQANKFAQWVDVAGDRNISIEEEIIQVEEFVNLKPTQNTINLCRVCSLTWDMERCFVDGQAPSEEQCANAPHESPGCLCAWKTGVSVVENHILDGHHHWAAVKLALTSADTLSPSGHARILRYQNSNGFNSTLSPLILVGKIITVANQNPDLVGHSSCTQPHLDQLLMQFPGRKP